MAESGNFKGSLLGISIGTVTHAGTVTATQKMWRSLQALGAIAFAYSFSIILIEIQVLQLYTSGQELDHLSCKCIHGYNDDQILSQHIK